MHVDSWYSRAFCVRTLPLPYQDPRDTPFPFDRAFGSRERKAIDLIITSANLTSAEEAEESFDLNVCKCSFNRATFAIPINRQGRQ
jgi:hypothetical protein